MNFDFTKIIAKRFIKAFVAGGLSALVVTLAQTTANASVLGETFQSWIGILTVAFISGGLLSLEKALQGWNPPK